MDFFKNEYDLINDMLNRIKHEKVISFRIYPIEELDEECSYKKSVIMDPKSGTYYAILEDDGDEILEEAIEQVGGVMEWHWDERRLTFFDPAYTEKWKAAVNELVELSIKRRNEREERRKKR